MRRALIVCTSLYTGRSGSVQSSRSSSGRRQSEKGCDSGCGHTMVGDMGEPELLDLLSQYEDEGGGATPPWHSVSHMTVTCHSNMTVTCETVT